MENTNAQQMLVVLADNAGELYKRMEREGQLLQSFSPRVVVVAYSAAVRDTLAATTGVLLATTATVPDDILATLDEKERLAVAAWVLGRAPKNRKGDGAAWDAEGFTPPDKQADK